MQKNHTLKSSEGVMGLITVTNYDLMNAPARAHEISDILGKAAGMEPSIYRELCAELASLCSVSKYTFKNRVLLAARTMQVGRLVGVTTYTGIINYGAVGTGTTAVADSDVDLDNEIARKLYATRSNTDDELTIDFFYTKADFDDTVEESGLIIDGTATADSGLLFNRALTGGWSKTSLEAMTVSIVVSIDAV